MRKHDLLYKVYSIQLKNSEPLVLYVGKSEKPRHRFTHHVSGKSECVGIVEAIKRHGSSNFELVIEDSYNDESAAFDAEVALIAKYRANGAVVLNITDGGKGAPGRPVSLETRQKQALANMGKKASPEARAKMSLARKGKKLGKYANARPAETITLTCVLCGSTFVQLKRKETFNKKHRKDGPFCNAKCRAIAMARRRHGYVGTVGVV